jgi:CheY-like chemotaxis protein
LERRLRLLVIDDEPALRQSIRRMLAPSFDVVLEDDPLRGLAKICEGDEPPFDAILCDVVMPNGGGEALYRAVAAFDARRAARIVFMTGGAPDEKTRNFLADQPQPVLEKPFRRAETIALLRAVAPSSKESASVVGP